MLIHYLCNILKNLYYHFIYKNKKGFTDSCHLLKFCFSSLEKSDLLFYSNDSTALVIMLNRDNIEEEFILTFSNRKDSKPLTQR